MKLAACMQQGGEESWGVGGKPAEVLPPVGAARLSGGGAARADSERRKSAVEFSLSDRVQAVARLMNLVNLISIPLTLPRTRSLGSAQDSSGARLSRPPQRPFCSSALTPVNKTLDAGRRRHLHRNDAACMSPMQRTARLTC